MKIFMTLALLISMNAYSQNSSDSVESKAQPVENMVKEAKKDRKKKVEMCHDCGKPEAQCDCKGEEHKKKG